MLTVRAYMSHGGARSAGECLADETQTDMSTTHVSFTFLNERTSQQATACRPTQADSIPWSYRAPIFPAGVSLSPGTEKRMSHVSLLLSVPSSAAPHVTAKKGTTGKRWSPGILAAVPRPSAPTLNLCHYLAKLHLASHRSER